MTCDPFQDHDHGACHARAIRDVEDDCATRGLHLTPARRRVLEILLDAPKALGAYDILGALQPGGGKAQPPTVYRALDFLVGNGFAHRLEKLNAYVACTTPGRDHRPAFLICRACDTVAEADAPRPRSLGATAAAQGFTIEGVTVEAVGLCPACAADPR